MSVVCDYVHAAVVTKMARGAEEQRQPKWKGQEIGTGRSRECRPHLGARQRGCKLTGPEPRNATVLANGSEGIHIGAGQRGGRLPGPYRRIGWAQPSHQDQEGQSAPMRVEERVSSRVREAKQRMHRPATGILPGLDPIRLRILAKIRAN